MNEMKTKFQLGDLVRHEKTGAVYRISALPEDFKILEDCAKPYYEYTETWGYDKVTWARRQDEFEDGRFILERDSRR